MRAVVNKFISLGTGKSARNDAPRKMYKLSLKRSICTYYSFIYHILGEINKQVKK